MRNVQREPPRLGVNADAAAGAVELRASQGGFLVADGAKQPVIITSMNSSHHTRLTLSKLAGRWHCIVIDTTFGSGRATSSPSPDRGTMEVNLSS
jgi:hypothetical protein